MNKKHKIVKVLPLALLLIGLILSGFSPAIWALPNHVLRITVTNPGSGYPTYPFILQYYSGVSSVVHSANYEDWNYTCEDGTFFELDPNPNTGYHFDHYHIIGWETVDIYESTLDFNCYSDFQINIVMVPNVINTGVNYTVNINKVGQGGITLYVNGFMQNYNYTTNSISVPSGTNLTFSAVPYFGGTPPAYAFQNYTFQNSTSTLTYFTPILTLSNTSYDYAITAYFTGGSGYLFPTPSPGTTPPFGFTFGVLTGDIYTILEMIVGCFLTFGGVLIFMKAARAWIVGMVLLIAGFFIQIIAYPNLFAVLAFSAESIFSVVFLYQSGGGARSK
jgi:hypothetical protein